MKIAITVIFVLILLIAAWSGYKRGFILSAASLAAIVVSLYLACLLSAAFSGEIVSGLYPFGKGYIDNQIESTVMPKMGISADLSVKDALASDPEHTQEFCAETFRAAGISKGPAEQMAQEAIDYSSAQLTDIPTAIAQVFCERLAYVAGTVIAFILVLVLLMAIGNIPNLTFRIPNHPRLDDVGGAVAGLINGVAYCILLCWALQFAGALIGRETLEQNALAKIFLSIDILTAGVGI